MTLIWIPYYLDLDEKPRVQLLARKYLKVAPAHACGLLLKAYGWLGKHITVEHRAGEFDARYELEDAEFVLDGIVDHEGFSKAMAKVKWWSFDGKAVTIRNYFEKNGPLALQRAAEQLKKHNQRETVPPKPGQGRDNSRDNDGTRDGTREGQEKGQGRDGEADPPGPTTTPTRTETKNIHQTEPLLDSAGDFEAAVRALVDVGVVEGTARSVAAMYPSAWCVKAAELATDAAATGARNPPGIAIARLKDGSAKAAVRETKAQSGSNLAREFAKRFVAERPEMKTQLGLKIRELPKFASWTDDDLAKSMPDEAVALIAAEVRRLVGLGEMRAKDVPLGMLTPELGAVAPEVGSDARPGPVAPGSDAQSGSVATAEGPGSIESDRVAVDWCDELLRREKAIAKKVIAAALKRPECRGKTEADLREGIPDAVLLETASLLERMVKTNEFSAADIPPEFRALVATLREAQSGPDSGGARGVSA